MKGVMVAVGAAVSGIPVPMMGVTVGSTPRSLPGVAVMNVGVTSSVGATIVIVLVAVGCGTDVHVGSGDGVNSACWVASNCACRVADAATSGVRVAVAVSVAEGVAVGWNKGVGLAASVAV